MGEDFEIKMSEIRYVFEIGTSVLMSNIALALPRV